MRSLPISAALILAASAAPGLAAPADNAPVVEARPPDGQVQVFNGIEYVCTGFGEDVRARVDALGYPLKLVFASGTGSLLADVTATITDAGGKVVFQNGCSAPWIFVDLPPGSYTAAATTRGLTETARLTVPAGGQTEQVFRFAEIME